MRKGLRPPWTFAEQGAGGHRSRGKTRHQSLANFHSRAILTHYFCKKWVRVFKNFYVGGRVCCGVMVYLTGWATYLIEKYYRPCGIDGKLHQYLEEFPKYLSRRLGMDENFWKEILNDPHSKIHELNLIEGALEYAVEKARYLSESQHTNICTYFKMSIENDWLVNWIAGYIRGFNPLNLKRL